jgi:hypothetical protein
MECGSLHPLSPSLLAGQQNALGEACLGRLWSWLCSGGLQTAIVRRCTTVDEVKQIATNSKST